MPLLKPESCRLCPFYANGQYYVPDYHAPNATVMLIAQNPGPDEEEGKLLTATHWINGKPHKEQVDVTPQPLIGATGHMLNTQFLPLSQLKRSEVSVGNAIRCRPGKALGLDTDQLPTVTSKMSLETSKTDIVKAIKHCADTHLVIPSTVKVVVAMGSYALFQLTGHNDSSNWRGYVLRTTLRGIRNHCIVDCSSYHDVSKPLIEGQIDVFATMHIASLYKGDNKRYFHSLLRDFHKLGQFLQGKWPLPLPQWDFRPPGRWPQYSSFDTEYNPDRDDELIRWSLCDSDDKLYCVEATDTSKKKITINVDSTVLIQNALADIKHLKNITDAELTYGNS